MFVYFDKLSTNGISKFLLVRGYNSTSSLVNAVLATSRDYSNPVRAELVEVYELKIYLRMP